MCRSARELARSDLAFFGNRPISAQDLSCKSLQLLEYVGEFESEFLELQIHHFIVQL